MKGDRIRILLVDDEVPQLEALGGFLAKLGHEVEKASTGLKALEKLKEREFDIVLTDFRMPGLSGIELIERVAGKYPDIASVIMTAYGTIDTAVKAMKIGATDYLLKPVDLDALEILLKRITKEKQLKKEVEQLRELALDKSRFDNIIYSSGEMEEVIRLASRVVSKNVTVLIEGESGTGKELIARAIHFNGNRKNKPFVPVNIAALPATLVEAELFGYLRGSFTGASVDKEGIIARADGGTLFIDEIGEIPPSLQVKLLRFLQESEYEPIGGGAPRRVDVRVIAATNRNLREVVEKGDFREDIYFRINVFPIRIPPLRERKSDIPVLIEYFVRKYQREYGFDNVAISSSAASCLMNYRFPGNVRELENIVQRALLMSSNEVITVDDLPQVVINLDADSTIIQQETTTLNEMVAGLEIRAIKQALNKTGGNQSKAAKLLGITERNLRYKISKHGLK